MRPYSSFENLTVVPCLQLSLSYQVVSKGFAKHQKYFFLLTKVLILYVSAANMGMTDSSRGLIVSTILLTVLSLGLVVLRLVARRRSGVGLWYDDWMALLCSVSEFLPNGFICIRHSTDNFCLGYCCCYERPRSRL